MTLVEPAAPPRTEPRADLPVAVIGAGPIGLAAAAELAERGIEFVVLEAGNAVGASVRSWGHVRLFSPWKHVISPAARRLLDAAGRVPPRDPDAAPNGRELVEQYLVPLSELPQLRGRIRLGVEVDAVTRQGMDRTRSAGRASTPFELRIGDGSLLARSVIDASGTFRTPNSLASNGLDPLGLPEVADLVVPALPDVLRGERARFAGRHVTVVGAGHSAANTLLDLGTLISTEPATRVTWVLRNASAVRVFTAESDELADRSSLGARLRKLIEFGVIEVVDSFEIVRLARTGDAMTLTGMRHGAIQQLETDLVVNATGFRPDLGMLREIRLDLDEVVEAPRRLAPLIDPNIHSCGTVEPHGFAELRQPEPDFFLAGMKSYGRAPTFLLATGYEQVRSIVAHLAGDDAAASDVRLVLPATGVCSTDTGSCC